MQTINPGDAPNFLEVSKVLGGLWIISTYEKAPVGSWWIINCQD